MNKVMIASMREQLRPSEAARTALLDRVGEIPNKREGNSVRKYFAVAACAALLLCAYPVYNVLKSQNPPKLHSYITVEAGYWSYQSLPAGEQRCRRRRRPRRGA